MCRGITVLSTWGPAVLACRQSNHGLGRVGLVAKTVRVGLNDTPQTFQIQRENAKGHSGVVSWERGNRVRAPPMDLAPRYHPGFSERSDQGNCVEPAPGTKPIWGQVDGRYKTLNRLNDLLGPKCTTICIHSVAP